MHPDHEPFNIRTTNAHQTILYIHGVMGSPIEFQQLLENVNLPNTNFKSLLLPGHGGSGKEFLNHTGKEWQAFVLNDIEYHFHHRENLILIGHSLGGLLALQAAHKYPVAGIILINTALRTRLTIRQMVLSLRVLLAPKDSKDPIVTTYRRNFSVSTEDWWTIPLWTLRLIDVMSIARQTEKLLPHIQSNIHIFQSAKDETVNPISAEIMKNFLLKSTVKTTVLKNSMHAHFDKGDLMLLVGGINEMVNEIESLKVVN